MSKRKPAPAKVERPEVLGPGGVPIVKLAPRFDFGSAVQIWQGAPKVGKTSTAMELGEVAEHYGLDHIRPFAMLFEPGSGGATLNCTVQKCTCDGKDKSCSLCGGEGVVRKILSTIEEMREWFEWAAKSPFNPVVLDTGDAMWQVVSDSVCVRMGIPSPTQSDHGIAWFEISDTMRELLGILLSSGKGLIIIMHINYIEKRLSGGVTIQTATFNMPGKSQRIIAGLANQILHFEVVPGKDGDKHVISTEARAGVEAGDQWGVFPAELELGSNAKMGAAAILSCFYDGIEPDAFKGKGR